MLRRCNVVRCYGYHHLFETDITIEDDCRSTWFVEVVSSEEAQKYNVFMSILDLWLSLIAALAQG